MEGKIMSKEAIITIIPALIMLGFAIFGAKVISSASTGGH
jgi:heme/copper-type cytochrome/quinol oxidase subunit 2